VVVHLADLARHRRLAGARGAGEDQVHRLLAHRQALLGTVGVDLRRRSELPDLLLDRQDADERLDPVVGV
jgi:hypothetical protein